MVRHTPRCSVLAVAILYLSGIIAAAQVGKAVISVPLIRSEMGFDLDVAGLLIATFATMGAVLGLAAGVTVKRVGTRRALIAGLCLIALANGAAAFAPSSPVLFLARIIEGIGFLGVVLSVPTILGAVVHPQNRDTVMAVWSAYMPGGIAVMLLCAPILEQLGWRGLWFGASGLAAIATVLVALGVPRIEDSADAPAFQQRFFSETMAVLRDARCLVTALAFFAYSCQIFALTFALPILLTSQHGLTLSQAGLICAAAMVVSTIGHLVSGLLLRLGIPIWMSIFAAFVSYAATALIIYNPAAPVFVVATFAAVALGVGGLAPGALYAMAPKVAPRVSATAPTIGLLQQASNIGQFAGPFALALWAQYRGWSTAPLFIASAAVFGVMMALAIRKVQMGATDTWIIRTEIAAPSTDRT